MTQARAACKLASDLALDLVSGTQLYAKLLAVRPIDPLVRVGIDRVCLFHVIVTLSKWTEFYDRYKQVIPSDVRQEAKRLRNQIKRQGIPNFRNTVVGHIWDKKANRPLTNVEVDVRLNRMLGGEVPAFMRWVHEPGEDRFPETAVSVMSRVKDRLREEYDLELEELDD